MLILEQKIVGRAKYLVHGTPNLYRPMNRSKYYLARFQPDPNVFGTLIFRTEPKPCQSRAKQRGMSSTLQGSHRCLSSSGSIEVRLLLENLMVQQESYLGKLRVPKHNSQENVPSIVVVLKNSYYQCFSYYGVSSFETQVSSVILTNV